MENRKKLPVGEESFTGVIRECYYVDKTLFIKDLTDRRGAVNLFTRPRRFGKTLNMDMLKTYYEKTDEDTSVYFRDLNIWKQGERYTSEQGKYPVVSMTLKGADGRTWNDTFDKIKLIVQTEFSRHAGLAKSDKVSTYDLFLFNKFLNQTATYAEYGISLQVLTRMLHAHYGTAPIILIDEYDVPIQAGYDNGYYDEAVSFMKDFLSNGLKTNYDLSFGVMTGVLRVSEESIFSGLNNLKVFSIMDKAFNVYFGFTEEETRDMLEYYGYADKYSEALEWYDGYNFGRRRILNPWSVINYVYEGCTPTRYWANTSSNKVLGGLLRNTSGKTYAKIASLLQGEPVSCDINENIVFPRLGGKEDNIFSLILFSGYLTDEGPDPKDDRRKRHLLKLPNREIREAFSDEIMDMVQTESDGILDEIWNALERKDKASLEENLRDYLISSVSFYNSGNESFYHGMWVGFCAYKEGTYYISSDREAGLGRYDLQLEPKDMESSSPAVIMEFKSLRREDASGARLEEEAKKALRQIDERKYYAPLFERGCRSILKVGIAFGDKDVRAEIEEMYPGADV